MALIMAIIYYVKIVYDVFYMTSTLHNQFYKSENIFSICNESMMNVMRFLDNHKNMNVVL